PLGIAGWPPAHAKRARRTRANGARRGRPSCGCTRTARRSIGGSGTGNGRSDHVAASGRVLAGAPGAIGLNGNMEPRVPGHGKSSHAGDRSSRLAPNPAVTSRAEGRGRLCPLVNRSRVHLLVVAASLVVAPL